MVALARLFPLIDALNGYNRAAFRADATAGVTTAVMLIPQGMAYALLAGLPPIHGVYAALVPPIVYGLLGTSRQLSVGPVAMDSLLVAAGVSTIASVGTPAYLTAAILLALMVGAIQVAMGLLRMGFLVNFLSVPVISGFTSAAAVIIGLSQAKHLLGVKLSSSPVVTDLAPELFRVVPETDLRTFGVGGVALGLIFALKRWAPRVPAALAAVVLGALAVVAFGLEGRIDIVGRVPSGLPEFSVPKMDGSLLQKLLPTAVTIALVAFMETISVGSAYAKKNKYRLDADRELIALGLGNGVGAFFGGYPVAGGLSRTAVNATAGARTNLAGLFASGFVGLSLLLFTPLFYYVPKAALAAIILAAVASLLDVREVVHLHKVKRADMSLLLLTFVATLFLGILPGIGVGVGASVLWFVVRTTRPHVALLGRVPGTHLFRNVRRNRGLITYEGVIALRMDAQFYFGNIAFLRETLERLEKEMPEPLSAVVLDFSAINSLDSSAESALSDMLSDYTARGVSLFLAGVKGPVSDVLESSGLLGKLGRAGRCLTVHEAITLINAPPRSGPGVTLSVAPPSAGARASGSSARL